MARLMRSLAALAVLLGLLAGVPVALLRLGRELPEVDSGASVLDLLLRPDDGSVLLWLVTVVAWLAWAAFALSVLTELATLLSRRRIRIRLPGLAAPQRLAAGLIVSVLALTAAPAVPHVAAPVPAARADTRTAPDPPRAASPATSARSVGSLPTPARSEAVLAGQQSTPRTPRPGEHSHVVQPGDDLWSLAERYYGQGREWRRIAAANPEVLTGGPDRLVVGWRLAIPGAAPAAEADALTVGQGETLSAIADRELGSPDRWRDLYRANRAVLDDPDELAAGMRLRLPSERAGNKAGGRAGAGSPQAQQPEQPTLAPDEETRAAPAAPTAPTARGGSRPSPRSTPVDPSAPGSRAPAGPAKGEAGSENQHPASDQGAASSDQDSAPDQGAASDREAAPDQDPAPDQAAAPDQGAASDQGGAPAAPPEQDMPAAVPGSARAPQAGPVEPGEPAAAPNGPAASPAGTVEPEAGGTGHGSSGSSDAQPAVPTVSAAESDDVLDRAVGLAGVGGLLAAGLLAGLAARRRLQLQARPVGRRIAHPPPSAAPVEVALGRRQRPLTLRTLDLALRAIGAQCRRQAVAPPPLQVVLVGEDQITFEMAGPAPTAPPPFRTDGHRWLLDAADRDYLRSMPGVEEGLRPWPTLVALGRDQEDRQVLVDLEALGLLQIRGADATSAAAVLAAVAVDLSFSPWAEEMSLTLVGGALPDAPGRHQVQRAGDVDALLTRLERRSAEQRAHHPHEVLAEHRLDPDLAEPWSPEVVLVATPLTERQHQRLAAVVSEQPRVPIAAVLVSEGSSIDTSWSLLLDQSDDGTALLGPERLVLTPQRLEAAEASAVQELVQAADRLDTTPAPWWSADPEEPDPPPDNVTYLGRRFGGWAPETTEGGSEMATLAGAAAPGGGLAAVDHPTLLLLGPVELLGAAGAPPPRAAKQCLEYCAWLLEHPGRTAHAMASALAVAEGTRRSNMSRLRSWLGEGADGQAYLPDAYSGRIVLHPSVSSDWERLRILTATGVNRSSTEALRAALQLVRGAPLADAAPGQWHWAEELRTDMISCLRDVGVELASRALEVRDLDLARWAAARALVAAPGDELLMATRIRTEHLAGNAAETERLTLQLAAQARRLGVDLDPETVTLLQQVMEGRVRARLA